VLLEDELCLGVFWSTTLAADTSINRGESQEHKYTQPRKKYDCQEAFGEKTSLKTGIRRTL